MEGGVIRAALGGDIIRATMGGGVMGWGHG